MQVKLFELAEGIYRISIAPGGRFEFNHFLIVDERPVLVHTGRVRWFEPLKQQVADLVDLRELAYIAFSHVEADECGSLNHWLRTAPGAVPLANRVGKASIEDFAIRKPMIVREGQTLDLGRHTLRVIETPHCPHNWEAMLYFEETEEILFASDLGAHWGAGEPTTQEDMTEAVAAFQRETQFMAAGRSLERAIGKLKALDIRYLATQHGSTLCGECIERTLARLKAEFGCGSAASASPDTGRQSDEIR